MKKYLIISAIAVLLCGCTAAEDTRKETPTQPETAHAAQISINDASIQTVHTGVSSRKIQRTLVTDIEAVALTKEPSSAAKLIVIDPGHQQKGNSTQEPIGPGATQTKAKVSSGTAGCASGLAEYELNLQVALKLQEELEARGYEVIMTRTSHEVDISNSERVQIANEAGADAFVRIHANGSEDSSVNGVMTICQTKENPYNAAMHEQSYRLSDCILEAIVSASGAKKKRIWETDTMSGINWSQVPSTIVEMGYMTNAGEDTLMASEEYQAKLVKGIVDGIAEYLKEEP